METWTRPTYPKNEFGKRQRVFVPCFAYTQEEARAKQIPFYNHYTEIPIEGSGWFKTDDNYVVYCRKHEKVYEHQYGLYILRRFVTDIGSWHHSIKDGKDKVRPSIKFALFKAGGYRPLFTKNDYIEKLPKHRLKAFVTAYVQMLLRGSMDYNLLGKIMRQDANKPRLVAIKTLKYWKVQEMVKQELRATLEKQGITVPEIINKFEEAYAVAKGKKDAQSMIRVAENYLDVFKKDDKNPNPYGQLPEDAEYSDVSKIVAEAEQPALPKTKTPEEISMEEEIQELLKPPTLPRVHEAE